jgi:hypothetical protein
MTYEEATKKMGNGEKVKQGQFIYFLGKKDNSEPYTLFMRTNKLPLIKSGFKGIKKHGLFLSIVGSS